MKILTLEQRLERLEQQLLVLRLTLGAFVTWTAGGANAPISSPNALQLLKMLDKTKKGGR